jgi:uncharacterized membrane protein YraQ (UPF0718 family)
MEGKKMLIPTIVVATLTAVLLFLAQQKCGAAWPAAQSGLLSVAKLFPILALALVAASCLEYVVPKEFVANWLGKESGVKGIFLGSLAGIIMPPGGAVVICGIIAGLLKAGAGLGPLVAFTTAYNLLALHRIPFELSILGWQFLVLRIVSVLIFAPLSGFAAHGLVLLAGRWMPGIHVMR